MQLGPRSINPNMRFYAAAIDYNTKPAGTRHGCALVYLSKAQQCRQSGLLLVYSQVNPHVCRIVCSTKDPSLAQWMLAEFIVTADYPPG